MSPARCLGNAENGHPKADGRLVLHHASRRLNRLKANLSTEVGPLPSACLRGCKRILPTEHALSMVGVYESRGPQSSGSCLLGSLRAPLEGKEPHIVFEACVVSQQHYTRVGPQALEICSVGAVSAYQDHCRHLHSQTNLHSSATDSASDTFGTRDNSLRVPSV